MWKATKKLVARKLNVSERSIDHAQTVLKSENILLISQAERGDIAVSKAAALVKEAEVHGSEKWAPEGALLCQSPISIPEATNFDWESETRIYLEELRATPKSKQKNPPDPNVIVETATEATQHPRPASLPRSILEIVPVLAAQEPILKRNDDNYELVDDSDPRFDWSPPHTEAAIRAADLALEVARRAETVQNTILKNIRTDLRCINKYRDKLVTENINPFFIMVPKKPVKAEDSPAPEGVENGEAAQ